MSDEINVEQEVKADIVSNMKDRPRDLTPEERARVVDALVNDPGVQEFLKSEEKLKIDGAAQPGDPVPVGIANQPEPDRTEKFCINDAELKLAIPMRDASDEQLKVHLAIAQRQHAHFTQQTMVNMQQVMMLAQACAALAYEQDRRAKSFQVITNLPANLTDIRSRRR